MAPDEGAPPEQSPPGPPPAGHPAWSGWWLASDGRWYPPWMPPAPVVPQYGQPGYVPRPYIPPSSAPPATPDGGSVDALAAPRDPFAPSSTVNRPVITVVLAFVAVLIAVAVIGSVVTDRPQSAITTSVPSTAPATTQPVSTVPQATPPPYTTVLPYPGSIDRLQMGQRLTLPPAANGGIASVAVVTFTAPYTVSSNDPYVDSPPPPGYEDAVAEIRECTGSAALQAGPSDDNWALIVAAGEVAPYGADAERPGLQQILYVAPHHCVLGYITFAVAPGSKFQAVAYAGSTAAVWLLPSSAKSTT